MIPAEPPSRTWVWAAATHVATARQVGEDETARRVARQALGVAEELGMPAAQADLLISLANIEGGGRRTPEGRERLGRARELARVAGNGPVEMRALYHLGVAAFESGELAQCPPLLADGLDRARRAGLLSSPYPLEMRYLQLLVMYTLGRWDECVRTASEASAALPPVGGGFAISPALYVALARGDETAADRARALLGGPFDWMSTLVAGVVLTDAAAQRGDVEQAVERTRAAIAALGDGTTRRPAAAVRLAALCLGAIADRSAVPRRSGDDADRARWTESAAELVELARATAAHDEEGRAQGPEGQAWLLRAEAEWATVASGPDPAAWQKAVAAFGYGDAYEQARCRLRYAWALLAAERRAEAAEQARLARETAAGLGAVPLLARIDALTRRGRLATAPTGADGATPLTSREQDVLRLLARGRSNRQIGEELFISGKTASVHVSNILAKLGAASRTEAVAIAYRQGWTAPEPTGSG